MKEIKGFALVDGARKIHRFPAPEGASGWLTIKGYMKDGPFGDLIFERTPVVQCLTDAELEKIGRSSIRVIPINEHAEAADGE